jgi:hypothetical protein
LDQGRYEGLIRYLEAESENAPAIFRAKVIAISIAAYIALFAIMLAVALLIYFGFVWARAQSGMREMFIVGMFALTMLPVFWVVLRFFFIRLRLPEGREITRQEAPKLFELLDKMRTDLKGPHIHHVLIDSAYNAAISQLPRWGLFGGHTNYLLLGLPYLFGVPPAEMLAIVAHEYGHLCGNHSKMGAWIYRQRITFGALHEHVREGAENGWEHAVLAFLLNHFIPYYNANTFALSRQQEYEADRTATELTGASTNAVGLMRDALQGRWVAQYFWPTVYKMADGQPQPAVMPFASMRTVFKMGHDDWATQALLSAAWREESDLHDTHPCLRERVVATGEKPKLPPRMETSAAEVLLGPAARRLADEFDQTWWQAEEKNWTSRHQYVQRSKQELQAFAARPMATLALHELQQFALLKAEFDYPQAAKPVLEYLLDKPGSPFAKPSYYYGRILLDKRMIVDWLTSKRPQRTIAT